MDPSRSLCKVEDSFVKQKDRFEKIVYKIKDDLIQPMSPRTRRSKMKEGKEGKKDYHLVSVIKDKIPISSFNFESNIFDKSSYILANIDVVYNFSGQEDGYIVPQIIKDFDFTCLNANMGFLKYIQYRLPNSRGFIPCVSDLEERLDKRLLNTNCDENSIVDYVLSIVPLGVDLVLSSKLDYKSDLVSALKLCKSGGTFVCRVNENIDNIGLFYITANCFESFSLFKPISEDLNDSFSYVIASNFKGTSSDWISLTEDKISVPNDFLIYVNNYYESLNKLKRKLIKKPEKYNDYKCKAIWNIF